jgi:tetratricopeptide (TPR) repeat protein
MFLLLSLAAALASPPDLLGSPAGRPAADATAPPAHDLAPPEELIVSAVDRLLVRDFEGVALLLDRAADRLPSDPERALQLGAEIAYFRGSLAGALEDHATALIIFERLLAQDPDGHRADDARARLAELAIALGRPADALRWLGELPRPRRLEPGDRERVTLLTEIARLDQGGRSHRRLERAVDRAADPRATHHKARAIARLARREVDLSAAVDLDGSERRAAKALGRRVAHLRAAEAHVARLLALQQPEWIFEGVLALADGFEQLGDDILVAPIPARLTAEQAEIYRDGIAEEGLGLWMRALRYADEGREAAARLSWSGRRVDALDARHLALQQKIGGP